MLNFIARPKHTFAPSASPAVVLDPDTIKLYLIPSSSPVRAKIKSSAGRASRLGGVEDPTDTGSMPPFVAHSGSMPAFLFTADASFRSRLLRDRSL